MADEFIEGLVITVGLVEGLKDRSFEIVEKPRYVDTTDFKDKTKTKRKLITKIKFADGILVDYYPNGKAQDKIMSRVGYKLANWVGFKGKFIVKDVIIGGVEKKGVYIE